ncbi:uncharacterized protein LOC129773525 [Toxorhynchites rutilus septentrionalis]|uniref:uncharacterized protein LOC129773525 n=1 Tax=Toxorhynchites rutilus septentrionalis TaxID=329112 RepID=UPI0024799C1B|nr:uncharacterized protein LOC129773525 [Toxorhynchites rutilus septentrionalis]
MNSPFGRTFLFLTNLAWKSRITLPVLISAGFMIMNFRWEVEINIHTERIAFPGVGEGQGGGIAAIDYSLEESWETIDSDDDDEYDDEDEESDYEDHIEYDNGDEEDESDDGGNDEVRRITLVTF